MGAFDTTRLSKVCFYRLLSYHSSPIIKLSPIKWMIAIAIGIILFDTVTIMSVRVMKPQILDLDAFLMGRKVVSAHFCLTFILILGRVIIRHKKTLNLLVLFSIFSLVVLGVSAILFSLSVYNQHQVELLHYTFNGMHVRQFLRGVTSVIPVIGIIMILTPIIIPASALQQVGILFSKEVNTGNVQVDQYLEARKKRQVAPHEIDHGPEVLLVEDDLASAALVMKFCKKLKLECRHFESINSAMTCFERYERHWKVVILDNFVRVENDAQGLPQTGSEWAKELNDQFPKDQRRFQLTILTGHSHLVEGLEPAVDFILQKPWNPKDLFRFLKEKEVI